MFTEASHYVHVILCDHVYKVPYGLVHLQAMVHKSLWSKKGNKYMEPELAVTLMEVKDLLTVNTTVSKTNINFVFPV